MELLGAFALVNKASSPGSDCVSYTELTHVGDKAKMRLLAIFNASWESRRLEPCCKRARVTPILKPGKSPMDLDSYCPIALLSCVGKLMEKMVLMSLDSLLMKNNAYPPQLSGFRKGRSSIDNVISLINCV
uniref:Putative tick transposon n=1 Tax=Rhipicephalus pulchellus TaxID=72859 RepID=L7LVH3_RHIPC